MPFVVDNVNKLQPGIFSMVLSSLWIPNIHGISGVIEKKAVAVGSTKLLCEYPALLSTPATLSVWAELLEGLVKLFAGAEVNAPTADYEEAEDDSVYNSGFSTLRYATKSQTDYFSTIADAQQYFAVSYQNLCQGSAATTLLPVVCNLSPQTLIALKSIFAHYGQSPALLP